MMHLNVFVQTEYFKVSTGCNKNEHEFIVECTSMLKSC